MLLFNTGCFYTNPTGAINSVKSEMKSDINRAIQEINTRIDSINDTKMFIDLI
jgi:hypothetical protein